MVVVEVRLKPMDLASHMAEMRAWLDTHRVDTAGFSYREQVERAIARLAFDRKGEAVAFAARFAGRVVSDSVPSPGHQSTLGTGAQLRASALADGSPQDLERGAPE
jgi:hypothetical protein